ncbi:MAG TPA: sugar hydrolase [Paenibacillus sp.]|jgi:hypothetical protein
MILHQEWIDKAEQLKPSLIEANVQPLQTIEVFSDKHVFQGWGTQIADSIESVYSQSYGKGDSFILDFGSHFVGYLSLTVRTVGSPPDAPAKLKFTFGEVPCEIGESFSTYSGWLSSAWLQEELLFLDTLPAEIKLPRRYAFRYVKVEIIDTSLKFKVGFSDITCRTVTSGNSANIPALQQTLPDDLQQLDRVAISTLQNCMQTVYEDGPKRDRRLWIGDLRLQAQANYLTFGDFDLVKRCLYLFAGMRLEDGAVGGCVFEKPYPHVDDIKLYDYALIFIATLYDYYQASNDRQTLAELWPVAKEQIQLGLARLDSRGIVIDDSSWWCFTDHANINKQASAQAILIYCAKRGLELAKVLETPEEQAQLEAEIERAANAAIEHLFDTTSQLFVSGGERDISWASQVWMVLAEILSKEANATLLQRLHETPAAIGMATPYMVHHYIEALFVAGMHELAVEQMQKYWGGMIADGADTFWEVYDPKDKNRSPYGSNLINSYCHAWSCTPTYFIRKYLVSEGEVANGQQA